MDAGASSSSSQAQVRFWNVREVFRVSETALTVSLRAISSFRGRRSRTSSAICVPICAGNLPAQESVTEVCKSCIGGRDYVRCAGDVNRAPRMLECLVLCEYRAIEWLCENRARRAWASFWDCVP